MTALTILWNTFAVIGLLSVVGSLGWFLFTWRTTASGQHDPTPDEVVAAHTGNVRVLQSPQVVKGQAPGSGPVPMSPPPARMTGGAS